MKPARPAEVSRESWELAQELFADRLPLAQAYADALAQEGVLRGLVGPNEVSRLWPRHLLNSALLAELVGGSCAVTDIGSGAGLPGIPLAIARPDLEVELIEPLQRRVTFLRETVARLQLTNVRVVRARAQDVAGQRYTEVVTARAVAPLSRLAAWCLPLCAPGGSLLALKGVRAGDELRRAAPDLRRLGAVAWDIVTCGPAEDIGRLVAVRVVMGPRDAAGARGGAPSRTKGSP